MAAQQRGTQLQVIVSDKLIFQIGSIKEVNYQAKKGDLDLKVKQTRKQLAGGRFRGVQTADSKE